MPSQIPVTSSSFRNPNFLHFLEDKRPLHGMIDLVNNYNLDPDYLSVIIGARNFSISEMFNRILYTFFVGDKINEKRVEIYSYVSVLSDQVVFSLVVSEVCLTPYRSSVIIKPDIVIYHLEHALKLTLRFS